MSRATRKKLKIYGGVVLFVALWVLASSLEWYWLNEAGIRG